MREDDSLIITVLLFAGYREIVGEQILSLTLPEFSTVSSLVQLILHKYPRLCSNAASLAIAINQEYQDHDCVLQNGDEVALIPPVSGGALFQLPQNMGDRFHGPR